MRYFDDTAKKSIAVCAKPDCTHDSSDCNAFYSMDYLSTPVYYYKGYIYMVRVDAGMAKVVRIQKDGSKREDVAELFANDGVTSLVTKEIYPKIANKYQTTSSRVERAIRHAIEISWTRGDIKLMEDIFGNSVDFDRSRPTNSEFLSTLADRFKLNTRELIA